MEASQEGNEGQMRGNLRRRRAKVTEETAHTGISNQGSQEDNSEEEDGREEEQEDVQWRTEVRRQGCAKSH